MELKNTKLIISDMDGTLLNSKGELSPSFNPLFKKITENNILFGVASGRQYYSLIEKFEHLQDQMIFIAENGAIAMEKGEEIHLQPMEASQARKIITEVRKIGGKHLILCGRKQAYIESTEPEFMKPFHQHYEKFKVVEDIAKVEDDIFLKVTVCDLSGAEENSYPKLKHLKDEFQVKLSGKIWIDFNHKSAQKGNALARIQELNGISRKETMTFGDYFNDIELFDHSAMSFAVENAHPEVKKAARYSAPSNDEDGVAFILKKLLEELETVPKE